MTQVKIPARDAAGLTGINQWLDENVSPTDCPGRRYYGLVEKAEPKLVGYEVIAECPDAPSPRVPLFFDVNQRYVETQRQD
ncbi:MAG: hypothetical protein HY075_13425 [Deltaproteobacteria bacterium]|nr:hypothetical protein [Deltaproteobacteria bacterium]